MTQQKGTDARGPAPLPTAPDRTDWTVVLRQPCTDCGFDVASLDRALIGDRFRATVPRWTALLARNESLLRTRPAPTVWSPIEYACHVRDVAGLFDTRLALMLAESDPSLVSWDQDEAAITGRYWEQDARVVSRELDAAVTRLATAVDGAGGVGGARWDRPGRRSDGSAFTVETLAAYALHELEHHLHDVSA